MKETIPHDIFQVAASTYLKLYKFETRVYRDDCFPVDRSLAHK